MPELPFVTRAEYRGGYQIWVAFSDGVAGVVDFEPWLVGAVFEPLRDQEYFRRFAVEGGTVAWPNGADVAPETLHLRAKATRVA
jgi:hypothetical protein